MNRISNEGDLARDIELKRIYTERGVKDALASNKLIRGLILDKRLGRHVHKLKKRPSLTQMTRYGEVLVARHTREKFSIIIYDTYRHHKDKFNLMELVVRIDQDLDLSMTRVLGDDHTLYRWYDPHSVYTQPSNILSTFDLFTEYSRIIKKWKNLQT